MTLRPILQAIIGMVIALFVFSTAPPAAAQSSMLDSLTGASSEPGEAGALETLIDDAKKDGATVIVIAPGSESQPGQAGDMAMNSELLLKARANVRTMLLGAPELAQRIGAAFRQSSYDGTPLWVIWAAGTAVLGIVLGLGTSRLLGRWVRNQFQGYYRPHNMTRADKLSYLMLRGVGKLLSTAVMFAVAILVAVVLDYEHEPSRMTIFRIVSIYAGYRIFRFVFLANFLAPDLPQHRMVPLDDARAQRLYNDWTYLSIFLAFVLGFVLWTNGLGINEDSFRLLSIIGLGLASILAAWLILRQRAEIAAIILGSGEHGPPNRLRQFVARAAVPLMLLYDVVGFATSSFRLALGLPGGYRIILAPVIVLVAGALVYAVAIVILDRIYERRAKSFRRVQLMKRRQARAEARRRQEAERIAEQTGDGVMEFVGEGEEMVIHHPERPAEEDLNQTYKPLFKGLIENAIVTVILIFAIGELARLWGLDYQQTGGHPLANLLDSVLIGVYTFLAYQAVNLYIDRKIIEEGGSLDNAPVQPGDGDSEGGIGESRLATLLPVFRNVFTSILVVVSGAFILATWGVNVAPLFAGAGVVGLAIGFGAQTLIRDIFSGVFFLIDDAFRKGEYIEVGTVKGVIEKISMRSFQLRHHLGAIHTIPFGEITQLTNYSRDWVMMKLPLRLTYGTDVEKVRKLVKKLGQELLKHEQVGHLFLQPLKSQGVYSMEDSAMIVRVKFMTRPGDQFVTRKVVYQAIRDLFEQEGIHFAHREVTVRLADDPATASLSPEQKEAISGSVRSLIDEEEARRRQSAGSDPDAMAATER